MKWKKLISGLLAAAVFAGLLPVSLAAGTPTVTVSSGEVKAGESVTLTVSIRDNPGLAACLLYLYFDTAVFEASADSGLKASGEFRKSGGLIGNSIEVARKNGRYYGDAGKDGVVALWYNSSGLNTSADGEMLQLKLKAKADAPSGSYTIGVGYSAEDTSNQKGGLVPLALKSGTVTLTGGKEQGSTPSETPGGTPSGTEPAEPPRFLDVDGHWAYDYIEAAAQLGLIVGYKGLYRPNDTMTRADCVTILWRACGQPAPRKAASFTDLDPAQKWYHDAVAWAEETGVVNGVGKGRFDPKGTVTREQLATILFRMSGGMSGMEGMLGGIYDSNFTDSKSVSSWARKGLYWSVYNKVYCGTDSVDVFTRLDPKLAADRAQIAVMIVRYLDMK